MAHRYLMHVFCNECGEPHSAQIAIERDELLSPTQSVGDIYDGVEVPPEIVMMLGNRFQCPNTGRFYEQRDNHQVFLVRDVVGINIEGANLTWPDGSVGLVHQIDWRRDIEEGRHAYIAALVVDHAGGTLHGRLRLSDEVFEEVPGRNDAEKSEVVRVALVDWVGRHGLVEGFSLQVFRQPGGFEVAHRA